MRWIFALAMLWLGLALGYVAGDYNAMVRCIEHDEFNFNFCNDTWKEWVQENCVIQEEPSDD